MPTADAAISQRFFITAPCPNNNDRPEFCSSLFCLLDHFFRNFLRKHPCQPSVGEHPPPGPICTEGTSSTVSHRTRHTSVSFPGRSPPAAEKPATDSIIVTPTKRAQPSIFFVALLTS